MLGVEGVRACGKYGVKLSFSFDGLFCFVARKVGEVGDARGKLKLLKDGPP